MPTSVPVGVTSSHTAQAGSSRARGSAPTAPATAAAGVRGAPASTPSSTSTGSVSTGADRRAASTSRPGHGVRDGHQPVRVVGDDVERARRPGDQQVLALPRGARNGDRHHQRHDQAEHAQHDPGRDRPALRTDLLVHRHRVAAHEGGLQPAQAER